MKGRRYNCYEIEMPPCLRWPPEHVSTRGHRPACLLPHRGARTCTRTERARPPTAAPRTSTSHLTRCTSLRSRAETTCRSRARAELVMDEIEVRELAYDEGEESPTLRTRCQSVRTGARCPGGAGASGRASKGMGGPPWACAPQRRPRISSGSGASAQPPARRTAARKSAR